MTYINQIHRELESLGNSSVVLASHFEEAGAVDWVATFRPRWLHFARLLNAIARKTKSRVPAIRSDMVALTHAIRKLHLRGSIDLVEMEETWGNSLIVSKKTQLPVVVRLHGPWFLNGPANGAPQDAEFESRVAAEGVAIAQAAGVSAPSQSVLDDVRAYYGIPLPHAAVIPNPIAAAPENEQWREDRCNANTIAFVGRFDYHKGGDVVLLAFEKIQRQFPAAKLVFIGQDSGLIRGATREQFHDFAANRLSASCVGKIQFFGRLPAAELDTHRRSAAVTVVASRYENYPYSLTEAMRLGCPVVATSVGGIPEMLESGRSGLLAKPDNPDDLAENILQLLRSQELRRDVSAGATQAVAEKLNPAAIAYETVQFYEQVLTRFKRAQV